MNNPRENGTMRRLDKPLCVWRCSECGARGWRFWDEPRGTCDRCLAMTDYEREVRPTGVVETP